MGKAILTLALPPISARIKKGHRVRIALAGHDKDTFARISAHGTPDLRVQNNSIHASHIDLPAIEHV